MGNNIGRLEIKIPKEIGIQLITWSTHKEITILGGKTSVEQSSGKAGSAAATVWTLNMPQNFDIKVSGDRVIWLNLGETLSKNDYALWGTLNSIINSAIIGKTQGFTKRLGLKGVGYKFEQEANNTFVLYIGLTHPKRIKIPESIECKLLKGNTILEGKCDNYQELTNELNKIRLIKPANRDKYSGKGFFIL